jgi:hypothetical protein
MIVSVGLVYAVGFVYTDGFLVTVLGGRKSHRKSSEKPTNYYCLICSGLLKILWIIALQSRARLLLAQKGSVL